MSKDWVGWPTSMLAWGSEVVTPGSGRGSGKPSKMGTSVELVWGSILGVLTKGFVRIGGILVGSGAEMTSFSSSDSSASRKTSTLIWH